MFTAKTLTEEEVLALPWRPYLHLPTPVDLAVIDRPVKINTVGPQANLQFRPGDFAVKSDDLQSIWHLNLYEASKLYAPRGGDCKDCGKAFMEHENFCSNCGRPLK